MYSDFFEQSPTFERYSEILETFRYETLIHVNTI